MIEYELINPSDPYTFLAPSRKVAALAVFSLSTGFGAKTKDDNLEMEVPVFLFCPDMIDAWYKDTFGQNIDDDCKFLRAEIADTLDSFMLGGFEDRKRYQLALDSIDDPVKKEKFKEEWQNARSSMNNIGAAAYKIARLIRNNIASEEGDL